MWQGSAVCAAALIALLASCCRAARLSSPSSVLHLPESQHSPKPPVYPASFEVRTPASTLDALKARVHNRQQAPLS